MADYLTQAIFHAFIAAMVVEALLRLWHIDDPELKIRFRLLVLVLPVVALPAYELFGSIRHQEWFEERVALFVCRRWDDLKLLRVGLYPIWLGVFSVAGVALYMLDVVPFLRERLGSRRPDHVVGIAESKVIDQINELCRTSGLGVPRLSFLERSAPFLLCAGAVRPVLIVSRGTLQILDDRELRAALAHELGHIARHDPLLSWILLIARTLQLFNPVFHVVARAIVRTAERRADDWAVAATKDPLALASGLIKLYRASQRSAAPHEPIWGPFVVRARAVSIEERCRRLLAGATGDTTLWGWTRLVATATSLSLLLFFVV